MPPFSETQKALNTAFMFQVASQYTLLEGKKDLSPAERAKIFQENAFLKMIGSNLYNEDTHSISKKNIDNLVELVTKNPGTGQDAELLQYSAGRLSLLSKEKDALKTEFLTRLNSLVHRDTFKLLPIEMQHEVLTKVRELMEDRAKNNPGTMKTIRDTFNIVMKEVDMQEVARQAVVRKEAEELAKEQAAAPKQEAPKQEAPKQEAPKQEAPKQEAPKQEAPKQEAARQKVDAKSLKTEHTKEEFYKPDTSTIFKSLVNSASGKLGNKFSTFKKIFSTPVQQPVEKPPEQQDTGVKSQPKKTWQAGIIPTETKDDKKDQTPTPTRRKKL